MWMMSLVFSRFTAVVNFLISLSVVACLIVTKVYRLRNRSYSVLQSLGNTWQCWQCYLRRYHSSIDSTTGTLFERTVFHTLFESVNSRVLQTDWNEPETMISVACLHQMPRCLKAYLHYKEGIIFSSSTLRGFVDEVGVMFRRESG